MATVDKKEDKKKDGKKDPAKKAADLSEFATEAQVKVSVTFFKEPFLSRCFICARNFRIINDKMASCDHTFDIKPTSGWVAMCHMESDGFKLDQNKVPEVETKYGVNVNVPVLPPYKLAQIAAEKAAKELAEAQKLAAQQAAQTPAAPA